MKDNLTRAGLPAFLATIESYAAASAAEGGEGGEEARAPRSYAGYPQVALPKVVLPAASAPPSFAQRLRGALRPTQRAAGSAPGLGDEDLTLAQALWQRRSPSQAESHGAATPVKSFNLVRRSTVPLAAPRCAWQTSPCRIRRRNQGGHSPPSPGLPTLPGHSRPFAS